MVHKRTTAKKKRREKENQTQKHNKCTVNKSRNVVHKPCDGSVCSMFCIVRASSPQKEGVPSAPEISNIMLVSCAWPQLLYERLFLMRL